MHYRIEFISNRFDKSETAGADNVNGYCGTDLVKFIYENLGLSKYSILNEDWGRGVEYNVNNEIIEIHILDLRPGENLLGKETNNDNPNWCVVVAVKITIKYLLIFKKFNYLPKCEVLGKQIELMLLSAGDNVLSSNIETD